MRNPAGTGPPFVALMPTLVGFVGLGIASTAMLILHLVAIGQVDPVSTTLSDYVFVAGYGWLFPTAVIGVAAAGFAVLGTLRQAPVTSDPLLRGSVMLASVCCLLVAAFPTTRFAPLTLSAQIHRYAAGVAFCCVPLAAWLLATRLRDTGMSPGRVLGLHRSAVASSLLLIVVVTAQLGLLPEPIPHWSGLFQRAQLLVQLVILGQLLHTLTRIPIRRVRAPRTRVYPERGAHVRAGSKHARGLWAPCQPVLADLPSPYARLRRDHVRGRGTDRHSHTEPARSAQRVHRTNGRRTRRRT